MMSQEEVPDSAPDGFGAPAPCVLIFTQGRCDLTPAEIHPRLNGIDTFNLDVTSGVPEWLDEAYAQHLYVLVESTIPPAVLKAPPPKFEVGEILVVIDFSGLHEAPQFPGHDPKPRVRVGPLVALDRPLCDIDEVMVLPGAALSAAVASLVAAYSF